MIRRLARACTALVAGIVALVGVPARLGLAVGWPLPRHVPRLAEVVHGLGTRGVSDAFIVDALAVVLWLAWAELAVCLVAEAVAAVRGGPAARVPLAGPAQPVARWVVATMVLAVSGLAGATPSPQPLAAALAHSQPMVALLPAPPAPASPQPAPAADRYVVVPGDNLWDIAEACVDKVGGVDGAAARTPRNTRVAELVSELFRLNQGRQQPDGRWLRRPNLIRPGWILVLPDGARVHVAPPPASPALSPAPSPTAPPTTAPASPVETVPAAPAPAAATPDLPATAPQPVATEVPASASQVAPGAAGAGPEARDGTTTRARVAEAMFGVSSALLVAGAAQTVRRRRRAVLSRATRGMAAADRPPELEEVQAIVAALDDRDGVTRMAATVAEAATHLVACGAAARPRVLQVAPSGVELFLSAPVLPAPPGWRPGASGAVWCRSRPGADTAGECPAPCLVTLGRTDDGADLYLDLEAEGAVAIVGDAGGVAGFTRAAVLELAHSPLAAALVVLVVGKVSGLRPGLDRVHDVGWEDALSTLEAWATQSHRALAANRWSTGLHARAAGATHDAVSPLVVVATVPPTAEQLERLARLPEPNCVSLVASGWEPPRATRVLIDATTLSIPSLRVSCAAQCLDVDAAVALVGLVEHAASDVQLVVAPVATPDDAPGDGAGPSVDPADGAGPSVDPAPDVLVRVLGDIDVVGGNRPLTPMQVAVVTYLTLHSPVGASRVEDAVWTAPTANRRKRLANTVSVARGALGAQHFPVAADGRYSVGTGVASDLGIFDHRVACARSQAPHDAIASLRGALELVRGAPFSFRSVDRAYFVWVDVESAAIGAELKVIDAALAMGELCLEADDFESAAWAARQGLTASPTHAQLTELLMRAYAGAGDRHAAARVFESHVNALQLLDLDEVAESTIELHEALSGRTPWRAEDVARHAVVA